MTIRHAILASLAGALALTASAKTEVVGINTLGYSEIDSRRAYLPIAIPYEAPSTTVGEQITVADVVLTAGLCVGDELYAFDHAENVYNIYVLATNATQTAKEWVPVTTRVISAGGATERTSATASTGLATGYGFWLHRLGESTNGLVQVMGQLAEEIHVSVPFGGRTLLGVPTENDLDLASPDSPLEGKAARNDLIEIPEEDGKLTLYRFDGTAWRSVTRGKSVQPIKAGLAFWYIRKGVEPLELDWTL